MLAQIRYIWRNEDGEERITGSVPVNAGRNMFGGSYTPEYQRVVLIPVEDQENSDE
jgi:hypothetical protein